MHDPSVSDFQHAAIRRQAHAWVVRLTSGSAGPDDVAAARAWCELAPAHQQAFVEARRLWELSGQLGARPHRPLLRYAALASAAVLVMAVGLSLVRLNAWDADYRTGFGERRTVQLADGSHLTLNAGSAVDVDYSENARRVILRRGDALFDVMHDPARPFTVQAGQVEARALGTVYGVRREGADVDVTVQRGRVRVSEGTGQVEVPAGQAVTAGASGLGAVHQADTDAVLAWRNGRLVFDQTPLAEVLEQIQRYRPGLILIGDEKLRELKVSGTFQLDRLDAGLATLGQVFGLEVQRYTDYLLVLESRR